MKLLIVTAALAALMVASASAETRNIQGFQGVSAEGPFRVEVALGDHYSVEVTGAEAARILTRLDHNSLQIRADGRRRRDEPMINAVVRVTTPRLNALAVASGASIRASGVTGGDFSVAASQGGEINVAGRCQELSAAATNGGVVQANGLTCATGNLAASNGGRIQAALSDTVHAAASLGGDIHVTGNPPHHNDASTMGGNITYN